MRKASCSLLKAGAALLLPRYNNICLMGRVLYYIALIMTPLYNCVCCNLYSSVGGVWHHPV
jgi:hypothetical protein